MTNWNHNTIYFEDLDENLYVNIDCKQNKRNINFINNKEYVVAWYYKSNSKDFIKLEKNNKTKYAEFNWANFESFEGVENFSNIKRLELHYCTKLINDKGISKIKDSIEWLHINQSKKFNFTEELFELKNLKVLCLNSCGDIESLEFLNNFPNLLDFRFVDTKIINGDISTLLKHPKLCNAGFLNKRHYSISNEVIDEELRERKKESCIEIKRGQFRTFMYKEFDKK